MKQKLLIASIIATLGLSACSQPSEQPATETKTETAQSTSADTKTADTAQAPAKEGETAQADHAEHNHEGDDHKGHDHEGHDHGDHAGHDHMHAEGDAYQCGDKTVHIVVHDHEGEIEAHLTDDSIVYDLNQDPNNKNNYTTNDGIQGENKGMTLTIDGDKAKVVGSDNAVLLDCTKKS